jgi:hypothetical protein
VKFEQAANSLLKKEQELLHFAANSITHEKHHYHVDAMCHIIVHERKIIPGRNLALPRIISNTQL